MIIGPRYLAMYHFPDPLKVVGLDAVYHPGCLTVYHCRDLPHNFTTGTIDPGGLIRGAKLELTSLLFPPI